MSRSIAQAGWLQEPTLQELLSVLSADGEEARINGGAVRNALLGEAVTDIDIATTCLPDETERRAKAAGFKPVPTGKAHGTITVVARGQAFEVTTLRADVETDGRHATVEFGRDWKADAERRDFTINALYATADGTVVDLVGGLSDLEGRVLRFIGDAETRIREDYLRILRFFRFFAWYGRGRPDAEGLKACARLKEGLGGLSAERVWAELKKLMAAPDPGRAMLWMRQASVLTAVLPESEKWGIDAIPGLIAAERHFGWLPDPLLRLEAIVPPDPERLSLMATRLRMSKAETLRLVEWAHCPSVTPELSEAQLKRLLYETGRQPVLDRLNLACAIAFGRGEADLAAKTQIGKRRHLTDVATGWKSPSFPLTGDDLVDLGATQGPELGDVLRRLKDEWAAGGFTENRAALLKRAREILDITGS